MNKSLKIFCDGGSRGNPGQAAAAFVVEKAGQVIFSDTIYLGKATNNVAEYNGVIHALRWLIKNKKLIEGEIVFALDSELIAKQITGDYKVKNPDLKKLHTEVKKLIEEIGQKINIERVGREKNKKADLLVNQELDSVL